MTAIQAPPAGPAETSATPPSASPPGAARRRLPGLSLAVAAGWALVGAAGFVIGWQILSSLAPDLPSPAASASELIRRLASPFHDSGPNDKGIGLQLAISLQRVAAGFALATAAGVPLGLALGASRRAMAAVNPIVQILRPVSPLAWFPIFLVMLRDAGKASVFVIFVTALWPTVVNTAAGAAAIPRDHRNVARVFRFGRIAYLRHILVPNALPSIVVGMRLSMGIAWMVIVAVEMLSGGTGIGFFVWDSYNASNLPAVAAAIAVIGAIGVGLDMAFLRLGRLVALEEVHQ